MRVSLINKFTFFVLFSIFVFDGCKKVDTTRVNTSTNADTQKVIASDELALNDEFDQGIDDAIAVACNPKITIKGASIDTTQNTIGLITIYYGGQEPDGTKGRSGSIAIQQTMKGGKPVPWGTAGTTDSIYFGTVNSPGYEIFFLTNNTSIRLTGTATVTNITGGLLQNVTTGDSLAEMVRASISFTYNDNVTIVQLYSWYLNQHRTFTKPDTVLYASTWADTVINGIKNVATWGTTRAGESFYSSLTAPIVQNISNLKLSYNPLSGAKAIENIAEPILSTYGVDQQGNPVKINSATPYGYVMTWINNGGQAQAVVPYYY